MKCFFVIGLSLMIINAPFRPAQADMTKEDQEGFAKFLSIRKESSNVRDFLEKLKGQIPEPDRAFLLTNAETELDQPVPVFEQQNTETILIKATGKIVPLKVISTRKMKYMLNNHQVDLSDAQTPEERWNRNLSAFAGAETSSYWMELFFPRASAGIVATAGKKIGEWILPMVGGSIYEHFASSFSNCTELTKQHKLCISNRSTIRHFFTSLEEEDREKSGKRTSKKKKDDGEDDDLHKAWALLKKRKQVCKCPLQSMGSDSNLDGSGQSSISEIASMLHQNPSSTAVCSADLKKDSLECIQDLANLAEKYCLIATREIAAVSDLKPADTCVMQEPQQPPAHRRSSPGSRIRH